MKSLARAIFKTLICQGVNARFRHETDRHFQPVPNLEPENKLDSKTFDHVTPL